MQLPIQPNRNSLQPSAPVAAIRIISYLEKVTLHSNGVTFSYSNETKGRHRLLCVLNHKQERNPSFSIKKRFNISSAGLTALPARSRRSAAALPYS